MQIDISLPFYVFESGSEWIWISLVTDQLLAWIIIIGKKVGKLINSWRRLLNIP